MRWVYVVITVIVLCSLQYSALSQVRAPWVVPDLLVVFVVFLALNAAGDLALAGAFLAGVFAGACLPGRLGVSAFCLTLAAWFLWEHRNDFLTGHWLTRAVTVAAVSLLCGMAQAGVLVLEHNGLPAWSRWSSLLTQAAVTALASLPLLWLFGRVRALYAPSSRR